MSVPNPNCMVLKSNLLQGVVASREHIWLSMCRYIDGHYIRTCFKVHFLQRLPSFPKSGAMDDESIEEELVDLLSCHRSDFWPHL